jgi:hypothetical protein
MDGIETLIPQAVADICAQAGLLDEQRQCMFLDWLKAHHHTEEQILIAKLSTYLKAWFEKLSPIGILWEYHLILDEIAWWRGLDEVKILRLSQGSR